MSGRTHEIAPRNTTDVSAAGAPAPTGVAALPALLGNGFGPVENVRPTSPSGSSRSKESGPFSPSRRSPGHVPPASSFTCVLLALRGAHAQRGLHPAASLAVTWRSSLLQGHAVKQPFPFKCSLRIKMSYDACL